MKIAMICTEMLPVPPVRGGAIQQYIGGIGPILAGEFSLTVVCRNDTDLPEEGVLQGVEYLRVPSQGREDYLANVIARIGDRSFDLIHVFNRPQWICQVKEAFPDSKLVLSLHNEMMAPGKISLEHGVRCLEALDAINTISRYVESRLVARFPGAAVKIRTIYSGADVEQFQPGWSPEGARLREETRESLGLSDCKVLLYSMRLSPKKGTHLLFEATRELVSSHPDLGLLVLGSKWYGKNQKDAYVTRVEALAEGLPVPVVLTGFVKPEEIHRFYAASDIMVCTSQWSEPLSRTLYEAMAAGVPIITTARGGNPEVVRGYDCGMVVDDYKNPKAFASALGYLLSNPEVTKEMGETGRHLALERYSWARVARDVSRMYHEVLGQGHSYRGQALAME